LEAEGKNEMKRKAISLLLVLVLLMPLGSAMAVTYYRVNTSWLKAHDKPSYSATVVDSYRRDFAVTIAQRYDNGWAKVRFRPGGAAVYVQTKYLQAGQLGKYQATENLQNFVAVNPYTVIAKALNARTGKSVGLRPVPSKASQEIRRLQAGDQLHVIARGSVWSQVVDLRTGKTGYVANDYVQAI
jgi:hypothetical protein